MKYSYKSRLDLADIYTESRDFVIISEMTEQVIDYLNDNARDILPFEHIFGDKMRIIIPLEGSKIGAELVRDLKTIKDFSRFSPITHEIIKKIKLNPKYATKELEKEQVVSIGKAINTLKIPQEKKKQYLDWYAKYKDYLEKTNLNEMEEYSIVLTRAPIDVVRMSDHRNISSCHSRGGQYFECAIQEAITGGGLAYLVHTDSLRGYSDEELQVADLFVDPDRSVRGVEPPIARLKIRRIESGDVELAVPETQIYGKQDVPEFYETVKEYLKDKQPLTSDELKKLSDQQGIHFRGGSYEDNDTGYLLRMYYDTPNVNYGSGRDVGVYVKPSDQEHERSIDTSIGEDIDYAGILDDELGNIQNRYSGYWDRICGVYYDVSDGDGDPNENTTYATYGGFITFDFTSEPWVEQYEFRMEDVYEISKHSKRDYQIGNFLSGVMDMDFESLSIDQIRWDEGSLTFNFIINENETIITDGSDFDYFCRNLRDIKNSYDEYEEQLINLMKETGLITKDIKLFEPGDRVREIGSSSNYIVVSSNGSQYQLRPLLGPPMPSNMKWVNVNNVEADPEANQEMMTFEQFFSRHHKL